MAKKKKVTRRRRRASVKGFDLKKINVMRGVSMAGGAVLSKLTTKLMGDVIKPTGKAEDDKTKGLMAAGLKFVAGIAVAAMVEEDIVKDIAYGFAAGAAIEAMPYVSPTLANPYKAGEKVSGIGNSTSQANNMRAYMQVSGYDPVNAGVGSARYGKHSSVNSLV